MINKFLNLILPVFILFTISGFTTANKVSGTVYDNYIEVIENVTVEIGDKKTLTDAEGNFTLEIDGGYPLKIKFSKEGYETKELELKEAKDKLEVVLEEL